MKTVSFLGKGFLILSMIFTGFGPALSAFADTPGCTDSFANNYDSSADTYDGSCTYGTAEQTLMPDLTALLNQQLDTNAPHYFDLNLTIHLVASDYTSESWQTYFDAVNNGLSTERSTTTTNTDIQSSIDSINSTRAALVSSSSTPAAPNVTVDDQSNIVFGMTEGNMEFNLDDSGWVTFTDEAFDQINLNGDHTLQVRFAAFDSTPASDITTLTLTTAGDGSMPAAPSITANDDANTVDGMEHNMEWILDNSTTTWTRYDDDTDASGDVDFTQIDLSGDHSLQVRWGETLSHPAGDIVTLNFTANQEIPAAPSVSADDINNVVIGIDETMEFNLDGAGFVAYSTSSLATSSLFGEHVITVRFMATGTTSASEENILIFTSDTSDEPGFGAPAAPDVTADDVNNTIIGIDTRMEYSISFGPFIMYDPDTFSTSSLFGAHLVEVRVAATGSTPVSDSTFLTFTNDTANEIGTTTPPAPDVTADDTANTVSRMNATLEYNLDNAGYLPYGNGIIFNALDLSGNHTLLVRVAATGTTPAGEITTLTFTTNPVSNGGGNGGGGGGGSYGGPFDGLGTLNRGLTIASLVSNPNSAVFGIGGPLLPVTFTSTGQVLGATTFVFSNNLTFGTRSAQVTELQNFLTEAGVYTGPITGFFGPRTLAAVKRYQAQQGLPQTGFVGPLTRGRINALIASRNTNVLSSSTLANMTVTDLINMLEASGTISAEKAAQARLVFAGR